MKQNRIKKKKKKEKIPVLKNFLYSQMFLLFKWENVCPTFPYNSHVFFSFRGIARSFEHLNPTRQNFLLSEKTLCEFVR